MFDRPIRFLAAFTVLASIAGLPSESLAQTKKFEPSFSPWGGFYIGVQGGYGQGTTDVLEDPANPLAYNGAGNAWSYDTKGTLAGMHVGVDWESYALVMGIETSFGYLAVEGEAPDPSGLDTIALGGNGYYMDVTGRIGFAPGNTLYYMKGGVAFADLGLEINDTCTAGACSATTIAAADSGMQDGVTGGVGIAYAFSPRLSARLEYAYYDFGSITVTGTSGGNDYSWKQEVNFHAVTAGVSFMF